MNLNNARFEILDPNNPENDVLHKAVHQVIRNLKIGGHLGFGGQNEVKSS